MSPFEPPHTQPTKLASRFIKSASHRVIHADGAWGGVAPNGLIRMSLYSEAQSVPSTVVYDISTGRANEISRDPKAVIEDTAYVTREIEVDVSMNLEVARSLHEWLGDKIRELEAAIAARSAQEGRQ